jgi:hypothetical protein
MARSHTRQGQERRRGMAFGSLAALGALIGSSLVSLSAGTSFA